MALPWYVLGITYMFVFKVSVIHEPATPYALSPLNKLLKKCGLPENKDQSNSYI